jgi:hypothetical protein
MAKWAGEGAPPYKGTIEDLTFYQLPGYDTWYVRARSSITRKRILKGRAFQGFRNSSVRMKDASPIASKVYHQLPVKQYCLFREMTGKALLLLKVGFTVAEVEEKLVEEYLPKPVKLIVLHVRKAVNTIYRELFPPFPMLSVHVFNSA